MNTFSNTLSPVSTSPVEDDDRGTGTRYFVTQNSSGVEHECPPESFAEYFELIEALTGLDRAMADTILRSGQKIDHPVYTFRSSMGGGR